MRCSPSRARDTGARRSALATCPTCCATGGSGASVAAAVRLDRTVGRFIYPVHRMLYRLTGGRVGQKSAQGPMLLLTTTGRKSGQPRTQPLLYMPDGDNYVVVASNGGRDQPPAWWLNLR